MTRTRKIVCGVIAGFLLALIAVIVLITTGVIGFHEDDDKAFEKPEIKVSTISSLRTGTPRPSISKSSATRR